MKKLFTILVLVVLTVFTSCEKQEEEELKGRSAKIIRITDKSDFRYNEPRRVNTWEPYRKDSKYWLTVVDVVTTDTIAMRVPARSYSNWVCAYFAVDDANYTRYDESTEDNRWIEQ
jgi:hypothetical protein